jgi:hypothetical protein
MRTLSLLLALLLAACSAPEDAPAGSHATSSGAAGGQGGEAPTGGAGGSAFALPAPGNLAATPGDGMVTLTWDAVDGASSYEVARASEACAGFASVGATTGTKFLDPTVVNGQTYCYVVRASGTSGASPDSAHVTVSPVAWPGVPTSLVATGGDGQVELHWTPGVGSTLARIRRGATIDGPFVEVGSTAGSSWLDPSLPNGEAVWYTVAATNAVGESAPTAPVQAIPIGPPKGLVAVASDHQVALFWQPVRVATGYEVRGSAMPGGPYAALGTTVNGSFVEAKLPNGSARHYRVAALTPLGASAPSAEVVATPSADANPLPPPEDPDHNQVGLNTWFATDWDGSFAFADVMKQSRPWQDAANWHDPVASVDELGWPTADASTVLLTGSLSELNGTYKLAFEGQADVALMWSPGSITNKSYDPNTNVTTADVTIAVPQSGSMGIVLTKTRRTPASALGTGFKNVRLIRPGYPTDGSVVFTQPFLDAMGKARVTRMMEWSGGGSNVVQRWSDRVTPLHATQGGLRSPTYQAPDGATYETSLGVALEHQIQLCNALMTDCWINVPPVADDDYVAKQALAIRFGTDGKEPYAAPVANPVFPPLHPSLRLYVEYANEPWNSGPGFLTFPIAKAIAAHLEPGHPLASPAADSIYTLVWRYPAFRIAGISETFRQVFGDAAMMTRVRPVLMTQVGNANYTLSAALEWLDGYAATMPNPRRVKDLIFGAGGSGYYGMNDMISAVPDTFFAPANYPDVESVRRFAIDSIWSRNYGVEHVAYEGGPGLWFSASDNRALNADPRMTDVMRATHDAWSSVGGGLLTYYNVRGPSEWECSPDIQLASTPKLDALTAILSAPRAPVTFGPSLPGELVYAEQTKTFIRSGFGYETTIDGKKVQAALKAPGFFALAGHAPVAFQGKVRVSGYAFAPFEGDVYVNGTKAGTLALTSAPGDAHLSDSTTVDVAVPEGLVVVRIVQTKGDFSLASITL